MALSRSKKSDAICTSDKCKMSRILEKRIRSNAQSWWSAFNAGDICRSRSQDSRASINLHDHLCELKPYHCQVSKLSHAYKGPPDTSLFQMPVSKCVHSLSKHSKDCGRLLHPETQKTSQ